MRAVVATVHNPWQPVSARHVRTLSRPRRIRALAPATSLPHVAILNGVPVLRAGWRRKLRDGDHLLFVCLPRGGGGSNGIIALVLTAFLAPYAVGLVSSVTRAAIGTLGQALITGVVGLAASALVNAVIPPPKPPSIANAPTASPTYNVQAQGNSARLDGPIPVQYGRLLAFPDFAAAPWTHFADNEQYLHQVLMLGQGHFDIEAIRIGDTPIANFPEIEVEIVEPGGAVSLFHTVVATASEVNGQEPEGEATGLDMAVGPFTASAPEQIAERIQVDIVAPRGLYKVNTSSGAFEPLEARIKVVARVIDDVGEPLGDWITLSSNVETLYYDTIWRAYDGNGAQVSAELPTVAFEDLPQICLFLDENGNCAQYATWQLESVSGALDDSGLGLDLSYESPTDHHVIQGASNPDAIRLSFDYPVAPARYEVAVMRLDKKSTNSSHAHEVLWGGLRAFLPNQTHFGDATVLAMRLRATNSLSAQASRQIGVVCTRKLPVWSPTDGWSEPVATESIAWALADACRASYGGVLRDGQIDLDWLARYDAIWAARGDTCGIRFDNALTLWEVLIQIAQCGRARPFLQGGVVRFVRDEPRDAPVALYSMRNIVRGSFSIDYLLPGDDTADAVDMDYFDARVWEKRTVREALPDAFAVKPARAALLGVTNKAQASREALYQARSNRYRRRLVKFETEMEGFLPALGDLIAISHAMPGWGVSGHVKTWDEPTRTLTVSEPPAWSETGQDYIVLRTRSGGLHGPLPCTPGSQADRIILDTVPELQIDTDGSREQTHYAVGPADQWGALAVVLGIRSRGINRAEINAVIEDQRVHV